METQLIYQWSPKKPIETVVIDPEKHIDHLVPVGIIYFINFQSSKLLAEIK